MAAIGNVPFGNFPVHAPAHNPERFSIHNYFILKSIALTAPGGYIAVITSRYTLDAADGRAASSRMCASCGRSSLPMGRPARSR